MKQFILLLCVNVLAVAMAHAQVKKDIKLVPKDSVAYHLPGVTIISTRIAEPVIEVPMAVTVLEQSKITEFRGYGLNEALSSVPGVLAQSRFGNQDIRITIRGFGARGAGDRSNAGTSRGIRVILDGIPQTEPDGRTSFDLIDPCVASRMEIVRSNASAVWGNAGGGVIHVSTIPEFEDHFIKTQFKAGSFGMREYTFQTATRFENTRIHASVVNSNFDGWRKHSSSERTLVNFSVVSELAAATKLGVYGSFARNFFNVPGPLSQAQFDTAAKIANPAYLSRKEHRFNRIGAIGFTLDHDVNDMHGFSAGSYVNPKYLQRSERNTFRDFTRYHFGGHAMYKNHWIINDKTKNMLIAGLDGAYQDGAILFYNLTAEGKRGNTLSTNKREGARNLGLFIQDEIVFFERTSVILGLRRDEVKYFSENYINPKLGLQMKSFTAWIPKAGVTYRFSPAQSVYANIGGGIEVPAGNETDPASTFGQDTIYAINPLLDPIRSTTFEIGTKQVFVNDNGSFFRSLAYDAALYLIQVTDDIIPYRGGRFYFTAGKTRRMGLELSTDVKMSHGLSLRSAFSYANNKYLEYKIDSVHYNKNLTGHYADYGQNKVAGLPDYFYSVSFRYSPEFFKYGYAEFTVQGVGKYFADDANTTEVPQYKVFNATVGFAKPYRIAEHFFVSGFAGVNNILNRKYAASAFINPDLDANKKPIFLEPGLPRNYFMALSVGWM